MAISARIDELKKKFDKNPRRYFAPLANEYRKAGDLEQAIAICRAYLPQQPGHMSGHIVFGQALFEARQLDGARGWYRRVLEADPRNDEMAAQLAALDALAPPSPPVVTPAESWADVNPERAADQ